MKPIHTANISLQKMSLLWPLCQFGKSNPSFESVARVCTPIVIQFTLFIRMLYLGDMGKQDIHVLAREDGLEHIFTVLLNKCYITWRLWITILLLRLTAN